jgi:hypothetical protein
MTRPGFQTLPLKEVRVEKDGTAFEIVRGDGTKAALRFLHQVTVRPTASLPAAIDAPLAFRGYCSADEMKDVAGKAVVCFGARRTGMTTGGQRLVNAAKVGAVGIINVDDLASRSTAAVPEAYVGGVRDAAEPVTEVQPCDEAAFADVVQGAGQDAVAILEWRTKPLPADVPGLASFRLKARVQSTMPCCRD